MQPKLKGKLIRLGGSYAVVIPKAIVDVGIFKLGDPVEIPLPVKHTKKEDLNIDTQPAVEANPALLNGREFGYSVESSEDNVIKLLAFLE